MNAKELENYRKSLEDKTMEELEALEKKIVEESDKANEKMSTAKLKVPTKNYKPVAQAMRKFIDKQSVQWQYSSAMLNMYNAWDPDNKPADVAYPILDATMRMLGSLQFTGHEEWNEIIMISEFFEPIKDEYAKISQDSFDIADKHVAIQDAMAKIKAIQEPVNTENNQQIEEQLV